MQRQAYPKLQNFCFLINQAADQGSAHAPRKCQKTAQAQQIAQKLGVTVGNIKSFQVRDYPTDYGAMYGMGGGGYGGTAPLESGSLKIVVTVDITYEFSLP